MQDENVTCVDLGKVSFDRAVVHFGTSQLVHATCFPMPQLLIGIGTEQINASRVLEARL